MSFTDSHAKLSARDAAESFLSQLEHIKKIPAGDRIEAIKVMLTDKFMEFAENRCNEQIYECSDFAKREGAPTLSRKMKEVVKNVIYQEIPF